MGRLPRIMSRLTIVTLLMLGCSRGGSSTRPSSSALPTAWVPPSCLIQDTSATTADTLFVMGAGLHPGEPPTTIDCDARRPRSAAAPVVVSLKAPAGVDLRDVLDLGVGGAGRRRPDVLVTRDPGVLAYAARREGYAVEALPWTVTYMLVAARPAPVPILPTAAERAALARDAVAADARGATEPFGWLVDSACASPLAAVAPRDARPVIAHTAGDATARQLAERIVSMSGTRARPEWLATVFGASAAPTALHVVSMPADSIAIALAVGRAVAAVVGVPRDPRTRCGTPGDAPILAGAIPLADARAHAIVRRGSGAAFLVAPDGSLHFLRRAAR